MLRYRVTRTSLQKRANLDERVKASSVTDPKHLDKMQQ